MKNDSFFLNAAAVQRSDKRFRKSFTKLIATIIMIFVLLVPNSFGQWVWSLTCSPEISCWDQEINTTAMVNLQATFTDIFTYWHVRGYLTTYSVCYNGAPVQNNAEATDGYFHISYDHWSDEMNGFNRILMTIQPGTLIYNGTYTQATTLFFPELCSPPPPGGGGCRSGFTIKSEKFETDEADNLLPEEPCGDSCALCEQNGGFCDQGGNCVGGSPSPIVIDTLGNGFDLTNAAGGVLFDIDVDGVREQVSWTTAETDDAWLALDRNENGTIDSGKELFGNFTPQPVPAQGGERNGFRALAEYDKPAYGGNNDNQIDAGDAIFAQLKLWQDRNHNGISEQGDLQNLSGSPIRVIELRYRESRRTDEHGNRFKYRAKVKDAQNAQLGRWAWDVFLVTEP
jgi:hypothetical protein